MNSRLGDNPLKRKLKDEANIVRVMYKKKPTPKPSKKTNIKAKSKPKTKKKKIK